MKYEPINLSEALNNGFENYKKIALLGGVILILFLVAQGIIGVLSLYILGVDSAINWTEILENPEAFDQSFMSWENNLKIGLFSAVFGAITQPLAFGVLKMAQEGENGKGVNFESAFVLYSKGYFINTFLYLIVFGVIVVIIDTVLLALAGTVGDLLSGVIAGVLYLFTIFGIPFILFKKLSWSDAFKESFQLVSENFLTVVAAVIVSCLFGLVGIIGCFIGMLFTFPYFYAVIFDMFSQATNLEEETELEEIGAYQN